MMGIATLCRSDINPRKAKIDGVAFRSKAGRANILGGAILILIGIEIFVTGLLGI